MDLFSCRFTTYASRCKEGTVRVKAIPGIGWLFDLLDHGEFKTKDFYLTPPPRYVSFVANWYKTAA